MTSPQSILELLSERFKHLQPTEGQTPPTGEQSTLLAEGFGAVAIGLLRLIDSTTPKGCVVVSDVSSCDTDLFKERAAVASPQYITAFNPELPYTFSSELPDELVLFTPQETLGLRAITLHVGFDRCNELRGLLALVFDRSKVSQAGNRSLLVLHITEKGELSGHRLSAWINADAFLGHSLGQPTEESVLQSTISEINSEKLDQAFGMPDVPGFWAHHLPQLGLYLATVGERFNQAFGR